MAPTPSPPLREVTHHRWDACRRQLSWDLPDADKWTFHRGIAPVLEIENMDARTIVVPVAQGCPETASPHDVCFVGTRGELDFAVDGDQHLLEPRDILRIPAGVRFTYRNVGLDAAVTFMAAARSTEPDPAQTAIDHLQWREYRRRFTWNLPLASEWGSHVGSGPHILSRQLRGHMVQMPPAQGRPWHAAPRDIVILHVAGDLQFHAGGRVWPLSPNDMLGLPKGTPYRYENTGFDPVLLLSIGGPTPAGKKQLYYAEDPGWPVREDAVLMETATGPEGEQRLVPRRGG